MSPHTRAIAAKWRALCDAPASDGGYDGAQPPTIVQAATIDHAGALADAFRRAARDTSGPRRGGQARDSRERPALDDGRSSVAEHAHASMPAGGRGAREVGGSIPPARQPIWRVLSARQSNDESRKIMADFRAGLINGLVAVHKLAIGTDAPDATIAVSARPSRSIIVWIQYVGRLMRLPKSERGNRRVTVLDCAGNGAPARGSLAPILERRPEVAVPATAPSRRRERPTTGAPAPAAVRRPSDGHAPCRRAGLLSVLQAAARARAG